MIVLTFILKRFLNTVGETWRPRIIRINHLKQSISVEVNGTGTYFVV